MPVVKRLNNDSSPARPKAKGSGMNENTKRTAKVDTRAQLLPSLIEALPDEYEILNDEGDIAV